MKQVSFFPKLKSELFKINSLTLGEVVAQLSKLMATVLYQDV